MDVHEQSTSSLSMPLNYTYTVSPKMLTYRLFSDEQDLPSLYEASMSVDALVADSIEFASRSSTPSVPPGFSGLPHAHPLPLALGEDTIPKSQSRIDPTSATFTPSHVSSHAPRVATPLSNVFVPPTPTQVPASTQGYGKSKQDTKSSGAKNPASQSSVMSSPSSTLQLEDFPALESSKTRPAQQASPAKVVGPAKAAISTTANKKMSASTPSTSTLPASATKINEKRPPPGLLNIAVPGKSSSSGPEGVGKSTISSPAFPPLSASSPSTAPLQSPVARSSSAKILRVASNPRAETPTIATPSSATSIHAPSFPPSRQPSLVSMSKHDRPGTPTSEITDNASTASAPLSRANSPPPSKIGSAPLRATTKSMQKKQRAQKAKEREMTTVLPPPPVVEPEPEPEIAPIQGRKKKQKKEKASSGTAMATTPAASTPPSPPAMRQSASQDSVPHAEAAQQPSQKTDRPAPIEVDEENKLPDSKSKGKAKAQFTAVPDPISAATEVEDEPADKPIPTPASILQSLVAEGIIKDPSNLGFLKPLHMNSRYQEPQPDLQNAATKLQHATTKLTITTEDRATLLSGRPVHKNTDGPNRIMLTPNGDCVRNLTPEEEQRYLELQSSIAQESGPAAFFSARHHASSGFILIGGRAVPNGPPTYIPQSSSATASLDPVSKIHGAEALSYINQYVLPSMAGNAQLENALNAKARDPDMSRAGESPAWAQWGNDPMSPPADGAYGAAAAHSQDGILASGVEGITAHFSVGRDVEGGAPLASVTMLSLRDAEVAMQAARKETEGLEKRLNALLKKNRRLLLGSGN